MKFGDRRWRGSEAAGAALILMVTLLLSACMPPSEPPPVVASPPPPPRQVVVERGQTLSGIAHAYHVPMLEVAEANHLSPPYRILVGQTLIVPSADAPAPAVAMAGPNPAPVASAGAPVTYPGAPVAYAGAPVAYAGAPAAYAGAPVAYAGAPATALPASPAVVAQPLTPPTTPIPPRATAPERLAATPPPRAAEAPLPPTPSVRSVAPASEPSHPPLSATAPATVASLSPPAQRSAAPPRSEEAAAPAAAEPPASTHAGDNFLWPVKGHVVEGYGTGPDGTRNDGINIAAPKGAAIEATDDGVVAYAGNELRGYGNLILIKHPNGWISAYAHCDVILVKTGQKVGRGQVIARVGATGNVDAPQLHFELRRGKKPVDPRQYLATSPAEAGKQAHSG